MCLSYLLSLINRILPWKDSSAERPSLSDDETPTSDSNCPEALTLAGEPSTPSLPSNTSAANSAAGILTPEGFELEIELERVPPGFAHLRLEDLEEYDQGGHHPVHLHDRLGPDFRYRVIHKLGSGGFANVWLCQDMGLVDTISYVALKIVNADNAGDDCFETKLGLLREAISLDQQEGICLPLDEFNIHGPNGNHLCFVYSLLGPKVSLGLHNAGTDPDKSLRRICYRLVRTLDAIHQAGLCHNDLTTANILHRVDGFDGLTEEEVFGILGEPKKLMILVGTAPNHNEVGLPQYLVLPIDWHQVSNQYILEDSKVIDFGQSFYVAEFQRGCGIPMDYRAPEVILEKNPGLPSDLWALGCVLFEIRTGLKLFPAYDNEDEALTRMVKILGKLPEPWWSTGWVNRKNNFDDGARLDCTSDQITESTTSRSESPKERTPSTVTMQPWNAGDAKSIQQRLRLGLCYDPPGRLPYIRRPISPEEIETFSDLLGQLLQFDPNCRISAGDVLKHSWFTM